MAVNQIYWAQAEDIHVVAGATSRTLDDLLWISHGAGPTYTPARTPPAGVTVRFRAAFSGALAGAVFSGFGVSVNQNTGAVTAASPLPGGHRLRNFLIHAEVRDTTTAPARDFVTAISEKYLYFGLSEILYQTMRALRDIDLTKGLISVPNF